MSRYRSQIIPNSQGHHRIRNYDGTLTTDNVIGKPALRARTISDVVVPSFRKRSALGEVFNNPLTTGESTFVAEGSYSGANTRKSDGKSDSTVFTDGGLITLLYNNGELPFPAVSYDMSSELLAAQTECISRVNATEMDLLNFVGEWSKTKRLHRDLGNALLKVFTSGPKVNMKKSVEKSTTLFDDRGFVALNRAGEAKRRYLKDARQEFGTGRSVKRKHLTDSYLATRMGLLPLISDLKGSLKVLMDNRSLRRTARSTVTHQAQSAVIIPYPLAYGVSAHITLTTTRTSVYRYGILYETSVLGRQLGQLGLLRPLSSAWELLPWSFVFDWFLKVGQWLDAIQPSGSHKTLAAWVSSQETLVHTAEVNGAYTASESWVDWRASWNDGLVHSVTTKVRTPWIPVVPMHPPLGGGFNQTRALDFAALVLQRIKSKI